MSQDETFIDSNPNLNYYPRMTEEELDKFILGRKVYNCTNFSEWVIDSIDPSSMIISMSNDYGTRIDITMEYFYKHCIFMDEIFSPSTYIKALKCECGTDSLGYDKHSSWCPKYKLEEK